MNDEMLIAFQRFLSVTCRISYNHYLSLSENVQQQILESFYNNDCNSDIVRALRNTSPATESKSFIEYSPQAQTFQDPSFISLIT